MSAPKLSANLSTHQTLAAANLSTHTTLAAALAKGYPVRGEQGFSPVVEVSKEDGVATVNITDLNGVHSFTVKDGRGFKDGETITFYGGNAFGF